MSALRPKVRCTNPECPAEGGPWTGQRHRKSALEAPCPVCSSAVELAVGPGPVPEGEPPPEPRPKRQPFPPPFCGVPKVKVDDVRFGHAANQRIAKLMLERQHRGKSKADLVGWVLDQWGAGVLAP